MVNFCRQSAYDREKDRQRRDRITEGWGQHPSKRYTYQLEQDLEACNGIIPVCESDCRAGR